MIFERINATGLGLTIGSIGNYSEVRNITFRDCYLDTAAKESEAYVALYQILQSKRDSLLYLHH